MIVNKIKNLINKGSQRTILAKKNILFSFFIKFFSMFVVFSMVSISINFLGKETYGVWLVLSGLITWANMFDLGFSHGLRNRLAEIKAKKNLKIGRFFVSTTYAFLVCISIFLTLLVLPLFNYINFQEILNTQILKNNELRYITIIIFIFFILQFIFKPIGSILDAFQLPSIHQLISLIASFLSLCIISFFIYFEFKYNAMYSYIYVVAGIGPLVYFIASIYFYAKKFKKISPSMKFIKLKYLNKIAGIGLSFFIIQFTVLIIFQSDNFIITYLFGPEEVTNYNIVYRYFSIIITIFGVIMSPFWSAFTDAYNKNDMQWIKKTMNNLFKITIFTTLLSIVLLLISDKVYSLWIDQNIKIPFLLSSLMSIYVVIFTFHNIVAFFSNGVGKLKIQLYAGIVSAIINIPISYFFAITLNLGTSGVLLGTITCLLIVDFLLFIQYRKIINNTAFGIWNK